MLTDREQEVAILFRRSFKNQDIVNQLGVGEAAVQDHIISMSHKLGVDSRLALILSLYYRRFLKCDGALADSDETEEGL